MSTKVGQIQLEYQSLDSISKYNNAEKGAYGEKVMQKINVLCILKSIYYDWKQKKYESAQEDLEFAAKARVFVKEGRWRQKTAFNLK